MKNKTLSTLLILFGILFFGMAWGGPKEEDYFPLHAGDSWKYHWAFGNRADDYSMKVLKEEPQLDGSTQYLVETSTSSQSFQEWYSKPKGTVQIHKTSYPRNNISGDYLPVKLFLQNPLHSGDTWSWQGTGIMGVKIEESNKVVEREPVTVPAGKFTAMRVDTDLKQNGAKVKRINWYAVGVGLVKSVTQSNGLESTSELLEYTVATPSAATTPKKMHAAK